MAISMRLGTDHRINFPICVAMEGGTVSSAVPSIIKTARKLIADRINDPAWTINDASGNPLRLAWKMTNGYESVSMSKLTDSCYSPTRYCVSNTTLLIARTKEIPLAFNLGSLSFLNATAASALLSFPSWVRISSACCCSGFLYNPSVILKSLVNAAKALKTVSCAKVHMRWSQSAWRNRML